MIKKTLLSLTAACLLSLSSPVLADEKNTDFVVAKVNDIEILYSEVLEAQRAMGQQAMAMPVEMIQGLLINSIADRKLVAAAARKDGFDETEGFKERMKEIEEHMLQREFLSEYAEKQITDAKIKAAYDKMVKEFEPQKEVRARHILLESEEDAKAVIQSLEEGGDFAELAKEKSTGPSGANGGDLGFFALGAMVPEFEKAAFSLKEGEFSKEPVKTQFGWHVIKVEEFRETQAPELEEVEDQLKGQIANKVVGDYLDGLRKSADIVLYDKDGNVIEQDQ